MYLSWLFFCPIRLLLFIQQYNCTFSGRPRGYPDVDFRKKKKKKKVPYLNPASALEGDNKESPSA